MLLFQAGQVKAGLIPPPKKKKKDAQNLVGAQTTPGETRYTYQALAKPDQAWPEAWPYLIPACD